MVRKWAGGGVALLVWLMALVGCGTTPVANGPAHTATLQFRADGTFKIMAISDIQDGANVSPEAITLITLALDAEQPDMVVFDGDNIFDWAPSLLLSRANVEKSIAAFLKPVIDRSLPFALVFGNHDQTLPLDEAGQWDYIQSFPGAVGYANPIDGRVGNYNVVVDATDGKPALNLWFFHSGGSTLSSKGTNLAPDQLAWYKSKSDTLKGANSNVPLPSLVFQHIPVPQIYDLLTQVPAGTPGAVKGSASHSGSYYAPNPGLISGGLLGEGPCPLEAGQAEFQAWLDQGDVMGAVFGHDHNNSFAGVTQGIELMYDGGAGFYSYGYGDNHGVRVIEFNQNAVTQFQTKMIYWKDLTTQPIPAAAQFDGTFMHGALWFYIGLAVVLLGGVVAGVGLIIRWRRRVLLQVTNSNVGSPNSTSLNRLGNVFGKPFRSPQSLVHHQGLEP